MALDSYGRAALVIAASDGAGSAPRSADGASLVTDRFVSRLCARVVEQGIEALSERTILADLLEVKRDVHRVAESEGLEAQEYACTFIGAAICDHASWFVQIGDGVVAYKATDDDAWIPAIWPHRGRYANETYFLTDPDAEANLRLSVVRRGIGQVAVLTDGLQNEALDPGAGGVVAAFLDPLLETLMAASEESRWVLSEALERFLQSEAVNERTDDDKTLILAACGSLPERASSRA